MKISFFSCTMCACLAILITTSTNAAVLPLEGRLPATQGGTDYQAYYDPNLGITWAANASASGYGTWDNQMAWVAGLAIGGVNDWRLPNGPIVDCVTGLFGICSDNEMAYLFHKEGISASAPGPFNIPFNPNTGIFYWSGTEIDADQATDFSFYNGDQGIGMKSADDYAWAVHDGDVATIPIPPALWLSGSGLLGLVGIARLKRAAESYS